MAAGTSRFKAWIIAPIVGVLVLLWGLIPSNLTRITCFFA
jgi:hypothetical protein